jgi:preprotein translocase subunit SecA
VRKFETRDPEANAQFLIEKIKDAYQRKSSHEEPTAVKSLERYIILNASIGCGRNISTPWMRCVKVSISGHMRKKDPLIEYKAEAYDMFVELMANIKNEVLHNLFRSTSNLQAFENFLATLPQFLLRETAPGAGPDGEPGVVARNDLPGVRTNVPTTSTRASEPENGEYAIDLPARRSGPKVGRNEPCPCGSGKNTKTAAVASRSLRLQRSAGAIAFFSNMRRFVFLLVIVFALKCSAEDLPMYRPALIGKAPDAIINRIDENCS